SSRRAFHAIDHLRGKFAQINFVAHDISSPAHRESTMSIVAEADYQVGNRRAGLPCRDILSLNLL
ncbi:MAG: hypothetical protein ABWY46_13570, partial [Pseudomonas sp.]